MKGIHTALVTPFLQDGSIDWVAFDRLVEQQVAQKVDGLVICGTTGESPTLTRDEKLQLFQRALERAPKGMVLTAGTGSNSTRETVELTREVEALGYERFLIVTPYYNKPSQPGLLAHFTAVADAVKGEIVLYNVPGRTAVSLTAKTIAALAAHPRITTLKEATGKMDFLSEIIAELRATGAELDLLSGDDATFLPFIRGGGVGTISVASHLLGRSMRELLESATRDSARADAIQERCLPLFKDLFVDSNPAPVKFCLSELGLIQNRLRLPLVPISGEHEELLRRHLSKWSPVQGALQ